MCATITWDQTLLSLFLSLLLAAGAGLWALRRAAHVLRRQETQRELRARREALDQVLAALEGAALEYLENEDHGYPQREMVELERCALQAQVFYVRDLTMQKALRDICYPNRHREATATIRRALETLEGEIATLE